MIVSVRFSYGLQNQARLVSWIGLGWAVSSVDSLKALSIMSLLIEYGIQGCIKNAQVNTS